MLSKVRTVMMIGTVVLTTGCWESTDVTLHEPGVYMGAADPLLSEDVAARSAAAKERFEMVQVDR